MPEAAAIVRAGWTALALLLSGAHGLAQEGPGEAERLAREGVEARREGRLDEALERLTRAAELEPENTDTGVQLGLTLSAARRFEDARRRFRTVLERAPGYDDARIGLARTFYFENRFEEAERELRGLAERGGSENPDAKDLAERIARAQAEAASVAAARRRPPDPPPSRPPAAGGESRPAPEEPARTERAEPTDPARPERSAEEAAADEEKRRIGAEVERLSREARAFRNKGQAPRAVDLLRRAARLQPDNADVQVLLGGVLIAAGRLEEAGGAFRKALAEAPDYADARIGLARLAFFKGNFAEAERELAIALGKTPGNAEGKALREQVAKARAAAEAAAKRERERAETARRRVEAAKRLAEAAAAEQKRLREALALRRSSRFREAEAVYRDVLRRRPRDVDLIVAAGTVAAFQGPTRFADARRDFERALALAPRSLDARLGLARLDLFGADLVGAEARVSGILTEAPGNVEALTLLARIRLAGGAVAEAEALFRQLAGREPGNADALAGLGDALRDQLRDEEALDAYRRASALDPASADIRSRLAAKLRPRWRLDLDGAYSRLTEGNAPWQDGSARLAYQVSPRTTLAAGVEASRRFGLIDVLYDGRVDHRLTEALTGYVRIGGTPLANFRPEILAETGGALRLWAGSGAIGPTLATLDLAFARYPDVTVQAANPGLQQYFLDGRLWFSGKLIGTRAENTDSETRARAIRAGTFGGDVEYLGGYLVRADAQLSDRLTAFVGYADTPDLSDGRVFQARAVFGGLQLALDERVSVRVSGAREDLKDSYDRTSVGLGLTTRF